MKHFAKLGVGAKHAVKDVFERLRLKGLVVEIRCDGCWIIMIDIWTRYYSLPFLLNEDVRNHKFAPIVVAKVVNGIFVQCMLWNIHSGVFYIFTFTYHNKIKSISSNFDTLNHEHCCILHLFCYAFLFIVLEILQMLFQILKITSFLCTLCYQRV